MKKDGIQTRNRKMSTKSKKKSKGGLGPMDLLRDKPFPGFASPNFSPAMHPHHPHHHHSMSPYMTSQGFGSAMGAAAGYLSHGSHPHHSAAHHAQMGSLGGGLGMGMGVGVGGGGFVGGNGFQSSFPSSFGAIPSMSPSGLNLSTAAANGFQSSLQPSFPTSSGLNLSTSNMVGAMA